MSTQVFEIVKDSRHISKLTMVLKLSMTNRKICFAETPSIKSVWSLNKFAFRAVWLLRFLISKSSSRLIRIDYSLTSSGGKLFEFTTQLHFYY